MKNGDDFLQRTPPHNLEAEKSVLGAILIDDRVIPGVEAILDVGDFYRDAHRVIFKAMSGLGGRQEPVDVVTLTQEMGGEDVLKGVGGYAYLAELAATVPSARHVTHYARIVRQKAILRDLGAAAAQIAADTRSDTLDIGKFLIDSEALIAGICRKHLGVPERPLSERIGEVITAIGRREVRAISTGFPGLDTSLQGGLRRGDLIVLAARPSVGKTALALNMCTHLSRGGTLFLSVEMRDDQLLRRALADLAGVSFREIELRGEGLWEAEIERLSYKSAELEAMNLEILKRRNLKPREVRREAILASHRWDGKLDLVVVDYLQLMQSDDARDNRNLEIAQITGALKDLAEELDCAVVLLSQLSRGVNKRESPQPMLEDLRDGGSIEQDADVVGFLWRPPPRKGEIYDSEAVEKIYLTIAKHRNGPLGSIELEFEKAHTRFREKSF